MPKPDPRVQVSLPVGHVPSDDCIIMLNAILQSMTHANERYMIRNSPPTDWDRGFIDGTQRSMNVLEQTREMLLKAKEVNDGTTAETDPGAGPAVAVDEGQRSDPA